MNKPTGMGPANPIAENVVAVDGEEHVEAPKNEPKNSEKEALKNLEG